MTTDERIKLQRKIRKTNKTMMKLFNYEDELSRFKEWFCSNNNFVAKAATIALKMTAQEFIAEAIKTNVDYEFYEEVQPITTFMMIKANVYEAFLSMLPKTHAHFESSL